MLGNNHRHHIAPARGFGAYRRPTCDRDRDQEDENASQEADEADEEESNETNQAFSVSALPTHFFGVEIDRGRSEGRAANDDDDDDIEDDNDEDEQEGSEAYHRDKGAPQVDLTNNIDENAPLSPWRTSKTKKRIIEELKNPSSDIHLFIGEYRYS